MKLSDYMFNNKRIMKNAKLLNDVKLINGLKRKKGDIITIMLDCQNGYFHAEDNDWATMLTRNEFEYI